jgi:hypothetical protein
MEVWIVTIFALLMTVGYLGTEKRSKKVIVLGYGGALVVAIAWVRFSKCKQKNGGGMILIIVVAIAMVVFLRRAERKGAQELGAMFYYCDMEDLYHELVNDPFMSSEKWKEWLPLFEDADRRFAEAHPYAKDFFRYADAVRREIDDLPLQTVGPS